MIPKVTYRAPTLLIGKRMAMSFAHNRTAELWQRFAPRRHELTQSAGTDFFRTFDPQCTFEKWAALAVTDHDSVPNGMDTLVLPAGRYAVFRYRGDGSDAALFYQRIYAEWLPQAGLELADRPHFAMMGDQYRHGDPDSEEDIWIPIQ